MMLPSRLAMVSHKAKIHSKADIRDSSGKIEASKDFQILFYKMNYIFSLEKNYLFENENAKYANSKFGKITVRTRV